MLKKTLITFFALFVLVNIWLWIKPRKMLPQYPRQAQLIQLEEYIYEKNQTPVVLVGSSMAAVLEGKFLGPDIQNLAIGGATIFEGLDVVLRSGARPRLVLVEANTLFYNRKPETIKDLFRPGYYQLRRYVPALRERNQPMNFIGRRTFKAMMVPIFRWFYEASLLAPVRKAPAAGKKPAAKQTPAAGKKPAAKQTPAPPNKPAVSPPAKKAPVAKPAKPIDPALARPPHIPANIFDFNLKNYTAPPDAAHAERIRKELREALTRLEARGARVIFLEIPMHCAFEQTPLRSYSREFLKRHFPPARYPFWKSEKCREYGTNDGLHMTGAGAFKFAPELLTRVLEVLKK